MIQPQLERAYPADADALLQVQRAAFAGHYRRYRDKDNPYLQDQDSLLRRMTFPQGAYYKLTAGDELAGGLFLYQRAFASFWLAVLYIHPRFQGRGWGRFALRQAMEAYPWAAEWGLNCPTDLPANQACYQACGFTDTGLRERINPRLELMVYHRYCFRFLREEALEDSRVRLRLAAALDPRPETCGVPCYRFDILPAGSQGPVLGRCALRVGWNEAVRLAGHVDLFLDAPEPDLYRRVLALLGELAYLHRMEDLSILAAPGRPALLQALAALGADFQEILPGGARYILPLEG